MSITQVGSLITCPRSRRFKWAKVRNRGQHDHKLKWSKNKSMSICSRRMLHRFTHYCHKPKECLRLPSCLFAQNTISIFSHTSFYSTNVFICWADHQNNLRIQILSNNIWKQNSSIVAHPYHIGGCFSSQNISSSHSCFWVPPLYLSPFWWDITIVANKIEKKEAVLPLQGDLQQRV